MEHNPIKTMYSEHDVISLVDDIIHNLFHFWLENPDEYVNEVNKLISFFQEYADKMHHLKEEDILFPALRDCPDFTLEELLSELETHHERFRDFTHKIQSDLNKKAYAESYAVLMEYCNDLLDHIAVENDELFVLAENILSTEELEKIYFKFEDVNREIGLDTISELESIVLKSKFSKVL